jgi:hypothetical protein
MKKICSLFLLLFFGIIAQAPTGYYSTATGTSYTLKTQLLYYKGHTDPGGLPTPQTSDVDNFRK